MKEIEKRIGYEFNNIKLLQKALTHSSRANELHDPLACNERLEFLGDSVLSIIVSKYLYRKYENEPEGELTKLRAALVCEKACCRYSTALGLGEFLFLGKGEEMTGGRHRSSILADAFEAVLAAIYLDGGIEPARRFVMGFIADEPADSAQLSLKDNKTTLQEVIQKNPEEKLSYVVTGESGPDHDKWFEVEVRLNSNVIGKGGGHSKKEAEQQAAGEALKLMGI